MASASVAKAIEQGREMFGEHPDDVIAMVETGSDVLSQLACLFTAIKKEAEGNPQIKWLAILGESVAEDRADLLDQQREKLKDALDRYMGESA